jgi:hypothetical protein
MTHAKLPIGIQDFKTIIANQYTYVDKTELIYRLITQGKPYFLSRPRRFGKSLLISTLHAIFSGKRDLFKGLWISNSDWNWIEYPIIHLDMSTINNKTPEMFEADLIRALNEIANHYNLFLSGVSASNCLENLIKQLSTIREVVVLIDEYDKPLIDNIDRLDVAKENRNILHRFYTILKAQDERLKFVFLTGVTQFSKISVFSGMNNLKDITMSNEYSDLLGYTKDELERYFNRDIQEVATVNGLSLNECYNRLKEWYNGYKFSKYGNLVYNPFSTLNFIDSKDFAAHWFATGTPAFLIDLIKKRQFDLSNLEKIDVTEQSFSSFEIEDLPTLPLLYQTGYLTIKSVLPEVNAFSLGFPNREVSQAFSESLLTAFASSKAECNKLLVDIAKNLFDADWNYSRFFQIMESLLALIPYDLYVKYEKHYQSLFYLIIKLAGFQINAEVHTQQGRADAVLELKDRVIVFEFKLDGSAQIAIAQAKQKKYHEIYGDRNRTIYLVGVNFNSELREIDGWQVEKL